MFIKHSDILVSQNLKDDAMMSLKKIIYIYAIPPLLQVGPSGGVTI